MAGTNGQGSRVHAGLVYVAFMLPALLGVIPVCVLIRTAERDSAVALDAELARLQAVEDKQIADASQPAASGAAATVPEDTPLEKRLQVLRATNAPLVDLIHTLGVRVLRRQVADYQRYDRWNGWGLCIVDEIVVFVLSLLPFAFIASRLAGDAGKDSLETASRPWVMKWMLGGTVALGWAYSLCPNGMGANFTERILRAQCTLSASSAPTLLELRPTPLIAGFVGWYLFFAAYMFYRARRGDVRGLYVYGVIYRKFLLTTAIAMILSIDPERSTALAFAALLVGMTPAAAFDIVRQYLGREIGAGRSGDPLADVLSLGAWDRMRLEEEGIDSLASLWMTDRKKLETLPFRPELVDRWYDIARLALIVGPERYMRVRPVCMTASEVLLQISNPEFRQLLASSADLHDPDELARLIREDGGPLDPVPALPVAAPSDPPVKP